MKRLTDPKIEMQSFAGLLTVAPEMTRLFETVKRVARTHASVLVRGETGTGKELVARALHQYGPRRENPFRALNCATLTSDLLQSELFGHVKGSFTGAIRDHKGLFALADSGTLFLDEIAELPLELQARLLRVLQSQVFTPVGGTDPVRVNVRFVSATHQSLRDSVAHGQFRADLMYRIRVVPLFLPRLAERTGDVEALTWHFVQDFNRQGYRSVTGITEQAQEALIGYAWPGNVRELRNVLEYAFAVGEGDTITLEDLTPELRGEAPVHSSRNTDTAAGIERRLLLEALAGARGRRSAAAERLGMSRTTLWRKLREHGIA
ncbi:MAG: two-component system response regulator AtoC [Bradymonadia bacterium]|jgi:two-component system response regulator AtoC